MDSENSNDEIDKLAVVSNHNLTSNSWTHIKPAVILIEKMELMESAYRPEVKPH